MTIAAPILPPAPDALDLPEEIQDDLRAFWFAWWGPLRDEVRAHPPEHDAPHERVVLARFLRGLLSLVERYGDILRPLLRTGLSRAFESLVAREEDHVTSIRRLGVKLLGRAVAVLGEVFEATVVFASSSLPVENLNQLLPPTDEALALLLDDLSVAVLRLELSVFVAFDLVQEESVEEFAFWARSAHVAAQRMVPFVSMLSVYSRKPMSVDVSADLVLPPAAFDRMIQLVEQPLPPSATLRSLLRRGTS